MNNNWEKEFDEFFNKQFEVSGWPTIGENVKKFIKKLLKNVKKLT